MGFMSGDERGVCVHCGHQGAHDRLKVRLQTADGRAVHTGWMPNFTPIPDIIIWGMRVFKFHKPDDITTVGKEVTYRECFAYALVT